MFTPQVIAHADWGSDPRKRWLARAVRQPNGSYLAMASELVGDAHTLMARLVEQAGSQGGVMLGVDLPLGLPLAYAQQVGVTNFATLLPQLGQGSVGRLLYGG